MRFARRAACAKILAIKQEERFGVTAGTTCTQNIDRLLTATGVIEAKKEGVALTGGVKIQSDQYIQHLIRFATQHEPNDVFNIVSHAKFKRLLQPAL